MKNVLKVIFGALVLSAPVAAQAQAPVDASVMVSLQSGSAFRTGGRGYGGNGGGILANFSVDFPSETRTFNQFLVWCIDNGRGVTVPNTVPYNYALYTVKDFAAGAFGSINGHDPDYSDMKRIASLQNELATNFSAVDRSRLQGSIWSLFDGFTSYNNTPALGNIMMGDANFNTSLYYVLWNGKQQTFIVKIPEPSSAILMLFAGLGAVLVVAARRRNIV